MPASACPIVLHGYWRSSAAYRVRIALALKGITYRQVCLNMLQGEHLHADYRKIAPFGLIPMLEIDGLRLQQSLAIIEYLEERYPRAPLLPSEPAARARVRALAQLLACEIHPLNNLRVLKRLRARHGADDALVGQWYRHWCEEGLGALEAALASSQGTYAMGDAPSLFECCLVPQLYNARRYHVDLEPFPRLRELDAACARLPAFVEAAPQRQPDAPTTP